MGYQRQRKTVGSLMRDPADWARETGWISRKQADELRSALRDLLWLADELAAPVDDGDAEWPQIAAARTVLAKRVNRYPKGSNKSAAMREP